MSDLLSPAKPAKQMNDEMLSSMRAPTWRWYLLAFALGAVVAWGLAAFAYQVMTGMSVTGKNRPVMWGFYITSFVFWVGLSHSGTMVSAILRLSQANWRRPILRAAEAALKSKATASGVDVSQARAQAVKAAPHDAAEQERLFKEFIEWSKKRPKR